MKNTNVKLSENEMELVQDSAIILTKNRVIEKVYGLFGEVSHTVQLQLESKKANHSFLDISPKIYKGEQYQQLPYVLLDYPRYFTKQHVFAIRCFFWWGNFFSISVCLKGIPLEKSLTALLNKRHELIQQEWMVYLGKDEWLQDFVKDDYAMFANITDSQLTALPFLRLSKKIPLKNWDDATVFFEKNHSALTGMLLP